MATVETAKILRVVFHLSTPQMLAHLLQSLPPMLHKISQQSMQSCSKAPWGLLVLAWSDGIFTANARSPRPSPRQCPHDYSIRAGLNLPDKEFRSYVLTSCRHKDQTLFYLFLDSGVWSLRILFPWFSSVHFRCYFLYSHKTFIC